MTLLQTLRPATRDLDQSDIVAVINGARNKPGIVPLWVGEGDLPTPAFIIRAAKTAMDAGETFYTWQRGIPELREALADYHTRHYGIENDRERFFVTGSGMQAIQLSLQALSGVGDEVIMTTPCWPNIHAATQVGGGVPVHVELDFSQNGWSLDIDKLFGAVTDRTRAMFINSPANPTGWVAPLETLRAILEFARERGIWIIADEVYHRFVYDSDLAPSFYELIEPEDRVIFVNTFSKNWAMTGWRAGWISAPPEIGQVLENLIQYSTSGVAPFTQKAAVTGLNDGEPFIAMQKERAQRNRDVMCDALTATGRVELAKPAGAFYLFFKVPGYPDSKELALRIIEEANVGLAPGSGFYSGGSEFLRMCYLRDPAQIDEGAARLVKFLEAL